MRATSELIFVRLARGVPGGASSECDPSRSQPGSASAIARTSGSTGVRCSVVTARGSSFPSLMSPIPVARPMTA